MRARKAKINSEEDLFADVINQTCDHKVRRKKKWGFVEEKHYTIESSEVDENSIADQPSEKL